MIAHAPTPGGDDGPVAGPPQSSTPSVRTARRRGRGRRLVGLVAVVALLSSGATYAVTKGEATPAASGGGATITAAETAGSASSSPSPAQMLKRVLPSVVNVRVTKPVFDPFGGSHDQTAEGSGVILSKDGVIVTNSHVVEGASSVRVFFTDGHDPMTATVLGTDPDHDLAVMKVDATDLTPITVGDSGALGLGDAVYAIGFPLDLGPTVTEGIVSGTDRTIDVQEDTGVRHLTGLLQTDAAINPGNSGGALVDASGRLVGIPTAAAQASSAENVGFAISIDSAIGVVRRLAG